MAISLFGEIYKIINAQTGKVYVGQTTVGYKKRFKRHLKEAKYYNKGIPRPNHVKKKISDSNKGQQLTPEQKRKQIEGYNKYREEVLRGKRPHAGFTGCVHTEYSKKKISKNRKGKRVKNILRPVKLIDKKTKKEYIFDCILDASRSLNIHRNSINNVLNGWSKSARNYYVVDLKEIK